MDTTYAITKQKAWFIILVLSVVWGCSFILIKKSLIGFQPLQLAFLRIGISGIAFLPIIVYHFRQIDWQKRYVYLAVGLLGTGIPGVLFFWAQSHIDSSLSGMLNSLTPIWTLIFGLYVFGIKIYRSMMVGVCLGFVGALILILSKGWTFESDNIIYGWLIVLATLCYGLSVNLVQSRLKKVKPILISSLSITSLLPIALCGLIMTGIKDINIYDEKVQYSLFAVSILALVGTFFASILFYYLVQNTSAVFGSMVTYLMPLVALVLGVLDGESITLFHIVVMSFILIVVYLSRKI